MIDIEVQGFQSIERTRIKVDGFSALVGRSNIGKSAFIRAVRCALTNPVGTSFVRHRRDCARLARKNGKTCKCFSSVHIKTDGFDLLWEKGDSVNRYHFNGQKYDKPGQGVPEFLTDVGFAPVKAGDIGSIQVADQFYPIFLLNQSGTSIAEAISDVSRLDRINTATRLVEKDRREIMSTRKIREEDVKTLESELGTYDGLDDAVKAVRGCELALLAVVEAQAKLNQLAGHIQQLSVLVADIRRLQEASSIDIEEPTQLEQGVGTAILQLRFHGNLVKLNESIDRLTQASRADVSDPEILTTAVARVKQSFRLGVDWARRSSELKVVEGLETSLQSFDVDKLDQPASTTLRLHSWFCTLLRGKRLLDSLEGLIDVPDTVELETKTFDLRGLQPLVQRLGSIVPAMRDMIAENKSLAAEEAQVDMELDALGVCPFCVQPLTVKDRHNHATLSVPLQD